MNCSQQITIENLISIVFTPPPKPPCTYHINLLDEDDVIVFSVMMHMLICGAQKLFGSDITPQQITPEQFLQLQQYILSVGYKLKHNYSYYSPSTSQITFEKNDEDSVPVVVNIWFEKLNRTIDCKGNVHYS